MILQSRVSQELLPYVQQPGQYIGREWNQLVRDGDWPKAEIRVAIAFPDAYAIGMSHLGCQIIYWLCNHLDGVCAERVYSPWIDAEEQMRRRNIPLFTWDTRQSVNQADILAISLQYEMGFTNVLTLLNLAGIPFRSAERDDRHPLVIAGGPQADNPEPMADFLDLVVIGDAEDSVPAILNTYRELKRSGVPRRDMIPEIASRFPWIYAPSLYDVRYHADHRIESIEPRDDRLPRQITRCQTPDFENAVVPIRPLVPHVKAVHDRISIEIMRGCPQRCRFCHAGYTKRPLRVRSVDKVLAMAREAYRHTGNSEIGLLSLSTADYPDLRELADRMNAEFATCMVNISLPSLRVDRMLQNIPWMANTVRKSGLTIAIEAARDDMRAAIRKKVTDGNLLDGVQEAYRAGWNHLKLYFMVGFPGERPEDIAGIVDLCEQISQARRNVASNTGRVTGSVGWLVPKPHTPFQWAAQPTADYFHEARRTLRRHAAHSKSPIRLSTHNIERSVLEAVFARGDRRVSAVIEKAWEAGARFDGWDEVFRHERWDSAFQACGVDPAWYAHRERPFSETLPWSHIASGPSTSYLERQYEDVFARISTARSLDEVSAL